MKDTSRNSPLSGRTLKKLYRISAAVVRAEGKKGSAVITLTGDGQIRGLNRKYRKIDRATDVLSFEMMENGVLGDIIISSDTAARNASRFGVSLAEELKRLVIHGTLHLLGYDHGAKPGRDKMRRKEDLYGKKIH